MKVATFFSTGASVTAGASVGLAGSSVALEAGASVAAGCPPQADRIILASTTSESRIFKLRFIFLLQENLVESQRTSEMEQKFRMQSLLSCIKFKKLYNSLSIYSVRL